MPVGRTALCKEMPQQWRAIGNTVSSVAGLRFKLQISCSRDEHIIARPTDIVANNFLLTIIFNYGN